MQAMFGAGRKTIRRLKGAAIGDDGNATIEFVILFPLIMFIFLSSFEVSIYLTRAVLLDRALDINVRLLRLGTLTIEGRDPDLGPPSSDELKTEFQRRVCDDTLIFKDCPSAIMIELTEVSTTTWDLPAGRTICVDRDADIQPVVDFTSGGQNDLMLIRACTVLDPFFGTTPYVMELPLDRTGGYVVAAASTFVNEP
ncbi:MAG: pilus assembly protein [Maritimibacter sp.]|nr:pilus assembly protein [Maritimibacter sp.]